MQATLNALTGFIGPKSGYLVQAFIVVFGSLLLDYIQRRILKRLHQRALKTENLWDDALMIAIPQPLSVVIWSAGIALAADIIRSTTGAVLLEAAEPIRDTLIIAAIAWFFVRFIKNAEKAFLTDEKTAEKTDLDPTTVDAISKLLRVSVFITAALVVLQTLGYSISGVLAFGGIGGIAVGFAAKDLLANFFGGLTIYLDRPFAVGDWVRSPDREIEGTVESIGWRLTRIRTFDKRPLYVPNSTFTTIAVENPSRMQNRRIYETVGIRYEDGPKMQAIVDKVKDMLTQHKEIDTSRTLIVNFNAFAPSSLDFFVYTYTKTTNWVRFHEIKQDVLLKIMQIIENEGAEIAFPTSTLHLPQLSEKELLEKLKGENADR